jgi:hypothetical protein
MFNPKLINSIKWPTNLLSKLHQTQTQTKTKQKVKQTFDRLKVEYSILWTSVLLLLFPIRCYLFKSLFLKKSNDLQFSNSFCETLIYSTANLKRDKGRKKAFLNCFTVGIYLLQHKVHPWLKTVLNMFSRKDNKEKERRTVDWIFDNSV